MFRYLLLLCLLGWPVKSVLAIEPNQLQPWLQQAQQTFYTPGMSVMVTHHGNTFQVSSGYADLDKHIVHTVHQYHSIASVTKSFTAVLFAQLVQSERLSWDSLVSNYLPELRSHRYYRHWKIRDLLSHQTGLASGVGDILFWPAVTTHNAQSILQATLNFTPQALPGEVFNYNNLGYVLAGIILERIYQAPLANVFTENLLKPLGLDCHAQAQSKTNYAIPYGHNDQQGFYPVTRNHPLAMTGEAVNYLAAGGLYCSTIGLHQWNRWLSSGGKSLLAEQHYMPLITPQVNLALSSQDRLWGLSNKYYAFGLRVVEYRGVRFYMHTGNIAGYQSYLLFSPALSLSISVLNNGSYYAARNSFVQQVVDHILGLTTDWVSVYQGFMRQKEKDYLAKQRPLPLAQRAWQGSVGGLLGRYHSPIMGPLTISQEGQILRFTFARHPSLSAQAKTFAKDQLILSFSHPYVLQDMLVNLDQQQLRLQPRQPAARFANPFQDVIFSKQ